MFEEHGWKVVRSGASLGEADLICLKNGECVLLQIKSTSKDAFYFYEYMNETLEGFPFFLVVDFGYGKIKMMKPQKKVMKADGISLSAYLSQGSS